MRTIIVVLVLALLLVWLLRRRQSRVTAIDPESPEWKAAVARAQQTVPLLRELFPAHPGETLGRIRGSFTTRAQVQVCRASGRPIPRELRGIEAHLVDE